MISAISRVVGLCKYGHRDGWNQGHSGALEERVPLTLKSVLRVPLPRREALSFRRDRQ